ncbi:MAG: conserved phage C-terminal domain-containing protein, partial [Clostridium sp.]
SRTIKTQGLIKARIAEGFTEEEFIKVIDNKVSEWVGTEYEKYLRPETLFGTKFESYLNQKVTAKTNTKNQESTPAAYKPFEF